jgi:CBS domain-containing protein
MLKGVVTAFEDFTVEQVYSSMLEGRFRHMPIVTKDKKLLGIVSDRDLRNVLVFINDPEGRKKAVGNQKLTISRVMTRDPLSASPEDSVKTAVKLMVKHKVGCLPVCDPDDKLLGIVTETDMLKLLESLLTVANK